MTNPGDGDDVVLKEIREIFRKISLCFEEVLCRNLNDNVLKIALINFSDLINESKILTSAYVDILLKASEQERFWALTSVPKMTEDVHYLVYSRDSLKYKMDINSEHLKNSSGEILEQLAKKMKDVTIEKFGINHLDLLIFCYENAEFDKLNTEVLDALINNTLDNLMKSMNNEDLCKKSAKVISKFFEVSLKGDTMISEFEHKLGDMFAEVLNNDEIEQVVNVKALVDEWISIYGEENAYFD